MKEYQILGGYLQYKIQGRHVEIVGVSALVGTVDVPKNVEDLPVTVIDKKAFLSRKYLRRVKLPDTVETVGDWAFAYCDELQEVIFESEGTHIGKAAFLDCKKLTAIQVKGKSEQTAGLLAGAVTLLEANYLLNMEEAGEKSWYQKWDARMLEVINAPDEEGYSKQVLCGEEDYGSTDLEAYKSKKREQKVRIAYLRLLYPDELQEDAKRVLEEYLRNHTKGCAGQEAWTVLWKEYGENRVYYTLFVKLGCVTEENRQLMLEDLGEDKPELKAYLMSCFSKENDSFFEDLFL